jgi:hypothetical protein
MKRPPFGPLIAGLMLCAPLFAQSEGEPAPAEKEDPSEMGSMLGKIPVNLGVFGNVDFLAKAPEGEHSGFNSGILDLYFTSRLSESWSALAELVLEGDNDELVVDLERFQIAYDYSDALRVAVGRLHNPLIRWNITQHHGLFMQTPIDKPAMTRWEDQPGLWPVHFVGLLVSGRKHGAVGLSYAAGVGNGRGEIPDRVQVASDANGSKAVVASIGVVLQAIPGLELSVSGYFDRIPAPSGDLRERDFTISTSYLAGGIELRAEWGRMDHKPIDGSGTYRTTGWYVLLGKSLPGQLERVRPFFVVDRLRVPSDEDFFEGASSESAWEAGVRWDIQDWVAAKGDYRSQQVGDRDREGLVRFQLAVSF